MAPSAEVSPIPSWVTPNLTALLRVERSKDAFCSSAHSLVNLAPGSVFARITSPTPTTKAYTSVQVSPCHHIELNSDLVFINHSCDPNLIFDMSKYEVRAIKKLKVGDELTFFYPSTEWSMDQPFDCKCGTPVCKRWINGAGEMPREALDGYWLNEHIVLMLKEKEGGKGQNGMDSVQNGGGTKAQLPADAVRGKGGEGVEVKMSGLAIENGGAVKPVA